jgi:pimeloyl-ACP methyl ester carboxylesterase
VSDDRVVRLGDGRSVGYTEYGDPDGFPIVNAHGGLACRLDVAAADAVATESGVRLISPDRPGIGLSDPCPGRTVLDWAHGVAELLDQIEVDRFAVMGRSMGGQYAAAVGHALRHRVTRVAIIAGAVIRGDGFATFARMSRDAARQLPGAVEEYREWARPWDSPRRTSRCPSTCGRERGMNSSIRVGHIVLRSEFRALR